MKRMIVTLSLTLIAGLAFAQEPGPCGPPHLRGPMPGMERQHSELTTALGLSADQKVQWDAIHQQIAASARPVEEQIGAADRQLRSLVESPNPDANAIGKQFLALHTLQQQIKTIHESTKAKIDAILTPDQKDKLESLHQRMDHGPIMMRHPEPGSQE